MTWRRALLACLAASIALGAGAAEDTATTVVSVTVRPPGLVSERELAQLLELPVPGPRDDQRLALTRLNLEMTGRFSAVEVLTEAAPGGVAVVFAVTPRPWARRLVLDGRSQLSTDRLLAAVDLRSFAAIPAGGLAAAAERITELYLRQGFPRPEVASSSRSLGADGATEVVFAIRETPLPELAGLELSESGHGPWRQRLVLRASALWTRLGMELQGANRVRLERRAELMERRLRSAGFAAATVSATRTADADGDRLTLAVDYGRRTVVEGDDLGHGVVKEVTEAWRQRRRPLTETTVNRFVREATAVLAERGYLEAEVTPELSETEDERKLVLKGRRGLRSYVEAIAFTGNASLPDEQLRAALSIAEPRWLGLLRSRPGPVVLEECARALEAHYATHGFAVATVTASLAPGGTEGRTVVFAVVEGPRRWVGKVALSGVTQLPTDTVAELLGVHAGEPWSQAALDRGVAAVAAAYKKAGFGQATLRCVPGAVDDQGCAELTVEVVEGERTVLGPTIVAGAFKTRPDVIQRLQREQRGEPFELAELARLQRHLNRLGAFEGVAIATPARDGAPAGEVAALVTVREAVTGYYELGFDYNSGRGFEVLGTVGDRNLFHRSVSASLNGILGDQRTGFLASLTQPLLLSYPLTNYLRVGYLDDQTNPGFSEVRFGGELGVEREFSTKLLVGLGYRLEQQAPYDVEDDVDQALLPDTKRIGALRPSLTWEGRDDPFNATRGLYFTARLTSSRHELGAAAAFDRLELDGRYYRTVHDSVVLAGALRLGFGVPRDGDEIPLSERFFIGGASSHRGFHEDELGPKGEDGSPLGGESFALANLELRFPIWGPLDGGVFADAGNVFLVGSPEADLEWAVGAGLRLRTPVGPVRVDLGYKLGAETGEDQTVVHFAIGHAF